MKTPKIGDIVLYHRYGSPGGEHKPEPSPAIITKTYDEPNGEVNLFVMNPNGMYFNLTPYSEKPKAGYWSWPEEEKPKGCGMTEIFILLERGYDMVEVKGCWSTLEKCLKYIE